MEGFLLTEGVSSEEGPLRSRFGRLDVHKGRTTPIAGGMTWTPISCVVHNAHIGERFPQHAAQRGHPHWVVWRPQKGPTPTESGLMPNERRHSAQRGVSLEGGSVRGPVLDSTDRTRSDRPIYNADYNRFYYSSSLLFSSPIQLPPVPTTTSRPPTITSRPSGTNPSTSPFAPTFSPTLQPPLHL